MKFGLGEFKIRKRNFLGFPRKPSTRKENQIAYKQGRPTLPDGAGHP